MRSQSSLHSFSEHLLEKYFSHDWHWQIGIEDILKAQPGHTVSPGLPLHGEVLLVSAYTGIQDS